MRYFAPLDVVIQQGDIFSQNAEVVKWSHGLFSLAIIQGLLVSRHLEEQVAANFTTGQQIDGIPVENSAILYSYWIYLFLIFTLETRKVPVNMMPEKVKKICLRRQFVQGNVLDWRVIEYWNHLACL